MPPPPVSAPWHTPPAEAPDRPTRRAEHRYADAVDRRRYAEPADAVEHRYADPADEPDHAYPDPADEPDHRYADPADRNDGDGRYTDLADELDRRYPGPADDSGRRYAEPADEPDRARPRPAGSTTADDEAEDRYAEPPVEPDPSYDNPVDGLVHAAVADRPLEEVIQLIEMLEQSPQYARATVDALRAAGTDRSVEDVSRLVALLTRPPRNADSADEAIRAAARGRPVEEVTKLMALLHRPPLEPHCGEAAVRAAATSRPVEELVELIGRMAHQQGVREDLLQAGADARTGTKSASGKARAASFKDGPPAGDPLLAAAGTVPVGRTARGRGGRPAQNGVSPAWPRLAAVLLLVLCGAAHFPPSRDGASAGAYGFALGAAALCVLLGLALVRRSTLPVLAAGILVPAALAIAQLLDGRVTSPGLSRALELTLAPQWLAGLAAVLAALGALTALVTLLASKRPRPRPDVRQLAGSNRAAD
ncbi:hypothetical protein QFZ75_000690 [Streptomyces sp. V3I8]|jgi:hypothetical protein|uniref:hypothetical protein n=1 Tax=Streptomyces sp. V3I8 TaxID=3042279 RepID=UPI00278B3A65|nr:hypothetical protein [Streptomyces sp. V3I8]MDQ1034274.1 hypothetical protein [Streptomyces sp. V3I8]